MRERLYYPELDGLRFLAFFLVFIHHLPIPKSWLTGNDFFLEALFIKIHNVGWIGVDIFFVLSSYLLTRLALIEFDLTGHIKISNFYYRRMLRIWPLYFFGLLLGFVFYPLFLALISDISWPDSFSILSIRDHAISFSLFLGNYTYASAHSTLGIYRSLWTVSLEEQFYLAFPFVIGLFIKFGCHSSVKVVTFLILTAWFARVLMVVMNIEYPWVWVSPITRLDPLMLGMLFGYITHIKPTQLHFSKNLPIIFFIIAFFVISCFPPLNKSYHVVWQLGLSGFACIGCLIAAHQCQWFKSFLCLPAMRFLGKISFGLYVYHRYGLELLQYFLKTYGYLDNRLIWFVATFIILLLTIAISVLSYYSFELPFLKLKDKYTEVYSRKP